MWGDLSYDSINGFFRVSGLLNRHPAQSSACNFVASADGTVITLRWSLDECSASSSMIIEKSPKMRVDECTNTHRFNRFRLLNAASRKGQNVSSAKAFLEAINANSDDDEPRLIYADWLEENGDAQRTEFIRLQIQSAGLTNVDTRSQKSSLRRN
jgi:uncharacterized protein (TIGR02996 family)